MERLKNVTCYGAKEALYNTFELCQKAPEGDFVECGVAYGGQLAAMYFADPSRTIWGYDSFEGIPMAGTNDTVQPGLTGMEHNQSAPLRDRLRSSGVTSYTVEQCEDTLKRWNVALTKINLVKGWFQDTLPDSEVQKIAVLRLDGDLYESTYCSLEHLYPRVVPGGAIIVDDYALYGCQKAVHDYLGDIDLIEVKGTEIKYFIKD